MSSSWIWTRGNRQRNACNHERQLRNMRAEIRAYRQSSSDLKSSLTVAQNQNSDLKQELDILQSSLRAAQTENRGLKQDTKTLQSSLDAAEDEISASNQVSEFLQKENTKLEKATSDLSQQRQATMVRCRRHRDEARVLMADYAKEKERTERLEQQIITFKQTIASSAPRDNDITDSTIQRDYQDMFCRIRDWVLQTINGERPNLRARKISQNEWLGRYLPVHDVNNKRDMLNCFMTLIAKTICEKNPDDWILGLSLDGPVAATYQLYDEFDSCLEDDTEINQWLLLTCSLLKKMQSDPLKAAKAVATARMVECIQQELEGVSTLIISPAIRESLSKVIGPVITLMENLCLQKEEYNIDMMPARLLEQHVAFDPSSMEDVSGEEEGLVRASIFPILRKYPQALDGQQDPPSVVVCKGTVVVFEDELF